MTVPANFTTQLAKMGLKAMWLVEIEGLPYAYSNRAQEATFYSGSSLPADEQFDLVRAYMTEIPRGVDMTIDPLEGFGMPGEFEFRIMDRAGTIIQAANVGREFGDNTTLSLSADHAAGVTTLNVGGSTSGWSASGTGYVGRTTFSYTGKTASTLTGVTMGKYRSDDVEHKKGEIVTRYPTFLKGRKVWYYLLLASDAGAYDVDDRFARFAGSILNYDLADDHSTWILRVRTYQHELAEVMLFRGLRKTVVTSGLPDADGNYERKSDDWKDGAFIDWETKKSALRFDDNATFPKIDGVGIVPEEWSYWRIDDEIIKVQAGELGTPFFTTVKRGLFNTTVVQHDGGAEIHEIRPIVEQSADTDEAEHSTFTAGGTPEKILLQLLVSGHAKANAYNVLDESDGAGFDPDLIDIDAFEDISDFFHADLPCSGFVDGPMKFKEFVVEHILKPFGLCLVPKVDNQAKITVKYQRPRTPTTGLATINNDNVIGSPKWQSGADRVVGMYTLEGDIVDGKSHSIEASIFTDTIKKYRKSWKPVTHRSIFCHGGELVRGALRNYAASYEWMTKVFNSRSAYLMSRYGTPPPVVTVDCLYKTMSIGIGDVVDCTFPTLPSLTGTGYGYDGVAEVLAKRPHDAECKVTFTLLLTGFQDSYLGYISPSGKLSAWNAGTKTATLNDSEQFSTDGDVNYFNVGDKCVFVSGDAATVTAVATVASRDVGAKTVTFDIAPGGVAAGYYLTYANYDDLTATQKATWVSMSDDQERLGASDANAFRYGSL